MAHHHRICLGVVTAAALSACDAKVDSDYKGEPLFSLSGSLSIDNPSAPADLVPALAFPDEHFALHVLDVESEGRFPGNFTLRVMSPPPPAAIHHFPGAPSVALAYITALPAVHASVFAAPPEVDGSGGLYWCDSANVCFRRIEQCIAGTDECYREFAQCHSEPAEGDSLARTVCDQIIEQSGDPSIVDLWSRFAGLSEQHFVLYLSNDAPAESAQAYLHSQVASVVAHAFGHGPLKAGYHLLHTRPISEAEETDLKPCIGAAYADALARVNTLHGTSFTTIEELVREVVRLAPPTISEHVYVKDHDNAQADALWTRGCLNGSTGIQLSPLSTEEPVKIRIGTHDAQPYW